MAITPCPIAIWSQKRSELERQNGLGNRPEIDLLSSAHDISKALSVRKLRV